VSLAKIDKLVKMANQIGDFFTPMPQDEATKGVATHLRRYWTPKMISEITDYLDAGADGLNPVAARGVRWLKEEGAHAVNPR
jgi:formate dehydrogenase subunit delta